MYSIKTNIHDIKNICIILLVITLYACTWSSTEKQEFKNNCLKTHTFIKGSISFTGFNYEELKSFIVKEKLNSTVINSFKMSLTDAAHHNNSTGKEYTIKLVNHLNVNHSYEFQIGNDKPYLLHSMHMVMVPQFSMLSENYGCEMTKFSIDNKHFKNHYQITIIKRGYKLK